MSLGLNIEKLAGPGRRALPLSFEVERELTSVDVALLASTDRGMVPPEPKRLTERHHALARLLAAGTPEGEASLILGYDSSRVSILKGSPAFQDLIAIYRSEVDREFTKVLEHMSGLSKDALMELRERMEESPDKFTNRDLLSITTDMIDRTRGQEESKNAPMRIELVGRQDDNDDS